MILSIFTIFDQQAKAFLPPFFMPTEGMAVRQFSDMVNDSNCQFNKHPKDYTLFQLGSFNDNSAHITIEKTPLSVYNGLQLLNSSGEQENEIGNDASILESTPS